MRPSTPALLVALLLATFVVLIPDASPAVAADGPGSGEPWIVSLGDSAISGEGGRWAGNSNGGVDAVDALGGVAYHDAGGVGPIGAGAVCLGEGDGAAVSVACDASPGQTWRLGTDDSVRGPSGGCLTASGATAVIVDGCRVTGDQQWRQRDGRLVNAATGACLTVGVVTMGAPATASPCVPGRATDQDLALPASGELVPGCHRSRSAAVHIDRTADVTGPVPDVAVNSINFACSGARTRTVVDAGKPGIDFAPAPPGLSADHRGQAALLEDFASDHNVGAVALLIGANDFGYAAVLERCVLSWLLSPSWAPNHCSDDASIAGRVSPAALDRLTGDIRAAITAVTLAMTNAGYDESMYTILVHTYWGVVPVASEIRYRERGYSRQILGGCGFWNRDADWGELTARPALNRAVTDAVAGLGQANVEVVDLGGIVRGHELCSTGAALLEEAGHGSWTEPGAADDSEWITQVRIGPALPDWLDPGPDEYQLQEGGHANYWGQLAMRNCLRSAWNGGAPRGVSCVPAAGGGLNAYGEPNLEVTVG